MMKDVETRQSEDIRQHFLDFETALSLVKAGNLLAREGWNGKNMFIFLVNGSTFEVNRAPLNVIFPEGTEIRYHGHIDMRTADGTIVPWLASQTDLLAEDWCVVELSTERGDISDAPAEGSSVQTGTTRY